jgi:hypothetical protein
MVFRPRNPAFVGAASGAVPDQVSGQDSAANSTSQITISWNAVTAIPAVTSYTVQRSTSSGSGFSDIEETVGNVTSIADASLSTYTNYHYKVRANNAIGSGIYSGETTSITNGVVPNQVTGLTATKDGDDIDLDWNDATFNTPDTGKTYTVQRSTSSGSGFSDRVTGLTSSIYVDSDPATGSTYYYKVKALNTYGSGAYSSETSGVNMPSPPNALIMGASEGSARSNYDYFNISTLGNATLGGTLTIPFSYSGGCAGTTRGYIMGAYSGGHRDNIDTIVIATHGNATDFGNLDPYRNGCGASSNTTYGVCYQSQQSFGFTSINRFTIGTSGNASAYGSCTTGHDPASNVRSSSRWINAAFNSNGRSDIIEYASFTSNSGTSDFGDLQRVGSYGNGLSNATRGIISGGNEDAGISDDTQYITIASTGNATQSGDLHTAGQGMMGVGNSSRGVFCGENNGTNMQYQSITSTATWSDFGDLSVARSMGGAASHY